MQQPSASQATPHRVGSSQALSTQALAGVPVTNTRLRSYPGLLGSAPHTAALYSGVSSLLSPDDHIWDVGCGSGTGTAVLAKGARTLGIETDPEALAFAKRFAPQLTFVDSVATARACFAPTVAVLIDVLGLCKSPVDVLTELRQALPSEAQIILAEPQAAPAQTLCPPVHQAFTADGLEALLVQSGFFPTQRFANPSGFVTCLAECSQPHDGPAAENVRALLRREQMLTEAEQALRCGDAERAATMWLGVLSDYPGYPRAASPLAQISLINGEHAAGYELALQAHDIDPCSVDAVSALALTLEVIDPVSALDAWERAARLAPTDRDVLLHLAESASKAGRPELGVAALERARDSFADEPAIHALLAHLLLATGAHAEAALEAQLARALDPASVELLPPALQLSDAPT